MVEFGPRKHQSPLTGPNMFSIAGDSYDKARAEPYGSETEAYHMDASVYYAMQANTAALVMIAEVVSEATGVGHCDLGAWREAIGATYPLHDGEETGS